MSQQPLLHRVGNARRSFFERGATPVGIVPDTILQSWQRCLRGGLSVDAQPEVEPLPDARLRELRERQQKLWRLARPELDGLAADIAAAGSIVLLTDEDGWILDAEGSPGFLDKAGRVALMPGVRWDETTVGTNAIGTAIVEGRSVEVRGGEHYFAPHGILTCSATPIFDPYGQRVGVLDISGDARLQHLHARVLARQAVAHIEHRYFDAGLADCELVRLHHDRTLLGTPREGILGFRGGRLVAANRTGLALFGLEHADIGHAPYAALFDGPLARLHDDGALIDRQGRALYGQLGEGQRAPVRAVRMRGRRRCRPGHADRRPPQWMPPRCSMPTSSARWIAPAACWMRSCRCCCRVRRARARRSSPANCTGAACAPTNPSSRSTARPCRRA